MFILPLVHSLAALAFAVGVLFLIFWAWKHLSEKQLKKWGWTLVIAGAVLCLLTLGMMSHGRMGGMMKKGMDHGMMWGMGAGHGMGMSMDDMTAELKGKTGDDFDASFITLMVAHHQGAIDMARLAATNAKHAEIKTLSAAIITAQQKEINQMNAWLKTWGYTK